MINASFILLDISGDYNAWTVMLLHDVNQYNMITLQSKFNYLGT